jgi:hypothetical protein
MTSPRQPKKRLGRPLPLTDEQLDQAARITPTDVLDARVLWLLHAPPELRDLLNARPEKGGT